MFCPECGKELRDGAKFCSACGIAMPTATENENDNSFDNTGFSLPNEGEMSPADYPQEQQPLNEYGDLDKTQAFIRPPYEYDDSQRANAYEQYNQPQEQIPDNGVYAPVYDNNGYGPEYNSGYEQGYQNEQYPNVPYQNIPYAPEYPQVGSYYPPVDYKEPKRKISAAGIILICCAIVLAVVIGAGTAVIYTQYDGFSGFLSSFSDDDKDEKDKDNKKDDRKDDEDEEEEEETTLPETTREITTLPPTTATTAPPVTQPVRTGDGYCGTNLQYDYNSASGELVIFGSGEMYDYSNAYAPWESYTVRRVIIEEGVTGISEGSLTSQHIEYIYLSSTVSDYNIFAVDYFSAIDVSPANPYYTSKDGVLFDKNCTVIICYPNENPRTSYTLPDSVRWIGPYAFFNSDNLTQLVLSPNVQYIDEYAFKSCNGLMYFTVPATVQEIETGVFYNWDSNQRIYFESNEVAVADGWNEGCSAEIIVAE